MDCQKATRIDCPCNKSKKAHEMDVRFIASFASRKLSKVCDEHLVYYRSPSACLKPRKTVHDFCYRDAAVFLVG